jgi:uncharacterized protein YjiS (DUF1127 family)
MNKAYWATVIGIVVTTSIASHLLAVGTLRPTMPGGLRPATRRFFDRLKNFLDDWIAAALARRERQAAIFSLHRLTDRELKDIGLYRTNIARDPRISAPGWQAGVCDKAPATPAVSERLR